MNCSLIVRLLSEDIIIRLLQDQESINIKQTSFLLMTKSNRLEKEIILKLNLTVSLKMRDILPTTTILPRGREAEATLEIPLSK